MTKKKVKFSLLTLPILILLNLLIPLSSLAQENRGHILKNFSGNVQIKKQGWRGFQNLTEYSIGLTLEDRDEFRLSTNATVIIICSNREEKRLPPGKTTKVSGVCPLGAKTEWNVGNEVQRSGIGWYLVPGPRPAPVAPVRGLW